MHIEPGLVEGGKIVLSYATATGALAYGAKLSWESIRKDGLTSLLLRAFICSVLVFGFFELLPHHPVGVSEVHLILGTTLLLVFGAAPAAMGLTVGLLVQGLFFAPQDGCTGTPHHSGQHGVCGHWLRPSLQIVGGLPRRHRGLGGLLGAVRPRRGRSKPVEHWQLWRGLHGRGAAGAAGRFGRAGAGQVAQGLERLCRR